MKRRDFIAAALAAPLLARAQAGRVRKIGILVPAPGYPDRYEALKAGLRELGWTEGRNLAIEWRHAEGRYERLTELTAELLKAGAELIVTNSTSAVSSARQATSTVPIVAAAFGDPVASGLVASLARPGGNVTGISVIFDGIAPKMFELASAVLPRLARPGIVHNSRGSALGKQLAGDLHALAVKAGAAPLAFGAGTVGELDAALAAAVHQRAEALLVMVEPFMVSQRHPIFRAAFRRSASFVDRILKGANPGELPVEQVTALELAINRKTAAALGIKVPAEIMLRADRVIE